MRLPLERMLWRPLCTGSLNVRMNMTHRLNFKRAVRACALVAAAVLLATAVCPQQATATDTSTTYAWYTDSSGMPHPCFSIDTALSVARSGKKITLACDWKMSKTIEVPQDLSMTIEMNGHKIEGPLSNGSWDETFKLCKNAKLTLLGNAKPSASFSCKGYQPNTSATVDVFLKSGGLVTQGGEGAVLMKEGSKLTVENVALVGNYSDSPGGAIYINEANCEVSLKNSELSYNTTSDSGAAISVAGKNATITLDNTKITSNCAHNWAGGIHTKSGFTTIHLNNHSEISSNYANNCGGGIAFAATDFKLDSDGTGLIASNTLGSGSKSDSYRGGGICVDSDAWSQNEGVIKNVTITGNKAKEGAGIYLGQEYTTVEGCTITDNEATGTGGGINNANDDNRLNGCTITGNKAAGAAGVWTSNYDITIGGRLIIEGNTNSDGSACDVACFNGTFADNYLTGNVDRGSRIGLRSSSDSDRKLAINVTNYIEGTFFLDQPEKFHLSYRSGDNAVWQVKGALKYLVTVNGEGTNRYASGETVTVNGAPSNKKKAFAGWTDATTGIVLTDEQKESKTISFTMRTNDVHLKAAYIDRLEAVKLKLDGTVEAGRKLPTTASVYGSGPASLVSVPVTWKKKQTDGTFAPATGKAEYGATYVAELSVPENVKKNIAFLLDGLKVTFEDYDGTNVFGSSSVDSTSGALYATSKELTTESPEVTNVRGASISVDEGITKQELLDQIPAKTTATTTADKTVTVEVDKTSADLNEILDADGKVKAISAEKVILNFKVKTSEAKVPSDKTFNVWVHVTPLQSYTVKFDLNGASGSIKDQTIKRGGLATRPADPEWENHIFQGWYDNKECTGSAFDFANTKISSDKTLYAKWASVPVVTYHKVTFNTGAQGVKAPDEQSVADGNLATRPADPVRSGFIFQGWFASGATSSFDFEHTAVTADIELTAKWESEPAPEPAKKTFEVTFETDVEDVTVPAQTVEEGGHAVRPADPVRTGYTFLGWYADRACSGDAFDFASTAINEKTVLYAKWEQKAAPAPKYVTVTFDTQVKGIEVPAQTVESGTRALRPADPVRENYTFGGWYENKDCSGNQFDFESTKVTANKVLFAKWNKIEKVAKPTLDQAEGDYETASMTVKASCETAGAQIKYKLSYLDNEWTMGEETAYDATAGIALTCAKGSERFYMLEVWAEKAGCAESDHDFVFYDLTNPKVETFTVTVKTTDTSIAPETTEEKFTVAKGEQFEMTAPYREGYGFDSWTAEDGVSVPDAGDPYLSIDKVEKDVVLTATYCPVVTAFEIGLNAPEADGALAESATHLTATAAGKATDMSALFDLANISWSPVSEDGLASCATAYTLKIPVSASAADSSAVYELADSMVFTFNGKQVEVTNAWFEESETGAALCVSFPATAKGKLASIEPLDDMELEFDEAVKANKSGNWNLPGTALLLLENCSGLYAEIDWDEVTGFDATKREAQTFTVSGTVKVPTDLVDNDGVSTKVTVTVHVKAPAKDPVPTPDDGDKKTDDDKPGDTIKPGNTTKKTTTTVTTTTTDQNLAATGDSTPARVAATVIAGACAIAAAFFLRRKTR